MKRLSTSVAIMCDGAAGNFQQASAVRSVLESFGLQVYFYQITQKQNVIDFLAGNYADCDYVIWFCYGCPDSEGNEQLNFSVVHQQENDYDNKSGWERVNVNLTPSNLGEYIKNPKGTLICAATSGKYWAEAFIKAGYKAYIAPNKADTACNSYTLFLTGFFYYLLMHSLDYTDKKFSPQESVTKAALMDRDYEYGTQLFEYYK